MLKFISRYALILILAFLVLYPMAMVFYASVHSGGPTSPGNLSFRGYVTTFTNPLTYKALWTTLWLSAIRTITSMSLAIFLAWIITRTDTPWRRGLEMLVWMVFLGLPILPTAVAWNLLANPKGLINQALMTVFHLESPVIDIVSYWGIIWVSTIFWASVAFLLITPAFRNMDASLEESSRMSGASVFSTIRRITVPILSPAVLGTAILLFIRFAESFEIELILGYSKKIYVVTTRIWWMLGTSPPEYPEAMALSSVFLLMVFGLIFLQWKLLGNKQFTTVTGKGFAPKPLKLGTWKYVTFGMVILYFLVSFILPFFTLVLGSFMKFWGLWQQDPFTLNNWKIALNDARLLRAFQNTVWLSIGAATVGMLLYSILGYLTVRVKFSGRKPLEFISWVPWCVPGLVLSLGFLWSYVAGLPFLSALYGTIWLMMLVFLVKGLPLGSQVMRSAMHQIGNELEESSRVSGASWFYTFRRVLAPLLSPAFISVWVILFVLTVKDVVTVLFLYTNNSRVLSVTFMEHWLYADYEQAIIIGLIMTVICMTGAFLARKWGVRDIATA